MSMFQPPYPAGLPIGPDWLPAPELRAVVFPYDRSEVALAPWGSSQMAAQALESALGVAARVEELPSHVRRTVLREVHSELAARRHDFESLLVLESGKPLVDCRTEVERSLVTL
ncbi:MAG: aldehyde dehydrogenase family protein, partial [Candidatus Dormibacteria bacterium]